MREAAAPLPCSPSAAASASSCAPGFRRFIDFRFSLLQPSDTVIRAGPAGILSPHRPHTSVACPLSRTSNLSVRSSPRPSPASRWALSRRPEDGDGVPRDPGYGDGSLSASDPALSGSASHRRPKGPAGGLGNLTLARGRGPRGLTGGLGPQRDQPEAGGT